MSEPVKVGIIGCGKISGIYLENLTGRFPGVEVAFCADLIRERAAEAAEGHGVPRSGGVEELLADPEIQVVVNLTIPAVHAEVTLAALEAGKHVYVEKPLAVTREEGRRVLESAREKGLRVAGAPDTFLGGGIQTCRKLIDDGWIGDPVGATAFMTTPGHERWHPAPEFYYKPGGGPMLDMGPYYLSALVNLLGPVARVSGSTRATYPERTITSRPQFGKKIAVEVPTHWAAVLEFAAGPVGMLLTSFDVWGTNLPYIEVYGTAGSLAVPNPNTFGGPVRLLRKGEKEWHEVPLAFGYVENSRGLGVADLCQAVHAGRPPRCDSELMYHVLDVMEGIRDAAESGRYYGPQSRCERPAPLALGLLDGEVG